MSKQQPKWKVIIAGTRADKQHPQTISLKSTQSFQQKFPSLPLTNQIFHFSALHNPKSVKALFEEIVNQCDSIMNSHTKLIPTYYAALNKNISSLGEKDPIINISSLPKKWKDSPEMTQRALHHLHSIGEIVIFGKDRICTRPEIISNLLAKFISPVEVRAKLLWNNAERVNLMRREDMETILEVKDSRFFSYFITNLN